MSAIVLASAADQIPSLLWCWPFVAILLSIAVLPLIHRTEHWWHKNSNKLLVAIVLSAITLGYYGLRGYGVETHGASDDGHSPAAEAHEGAATAPAPADAQAGGGHGAPHGADQGESPASAAGAGAAAHHARTDPGLPTVLAVLQHSVLLEYVPFMMLLFSLYVISGGVLVRGDIRATPFANAAIIGFGGLIASAIGTTGASMVLIRFLLKTNSERRFRVHTVVFFIFVVSNCGGLLLPTGDPPLFMGYLYGVPFFWTTMLWKEWLFVNAALLVIYFVWDSWSYSHEQAAAIELDITRVEPLRVAGTINLLWLMLVVAAVATLDSSKPFPGTDWRPPPYLREGVQLALVGLSLATTARGLRAANGFNYTAIGEVACLFIGIFITMQAPIEILRAKGASLGLDEPWEFFWATGILSSFLDNAPTYVVFFATAGTLHPAGLHFLENVQTATGQIATELLIAVSCGAVMMGANTYIGNGPNFMVKSIAEQSGVKMPSFFGYMLYAIGVLIPLFVAVTFVFFR